MADQTQEMTTYATVLLDLNPTEVDCRKSKNSDMYMCLMKRGDSVVGEEIIPKDKFGKFQSVCISYALVKSLQDEYGIDKIAKTSVILPSVRFPTENETIYSVKVKLNTTFNANDIMTYVEENGNEFVNIKLDVQFD